MAAMKAIAFSLVVALAATPALAQPSDHPLADSTAKAARTAAAEPSASSDGGHRLLWPGLALGIAGITTSVLAATVARVEDNSSGNAPPTAYQGCVAQKRDPIYASNNCDALKAKNVPLLAAGVALGAGGAALMIAGRRTSAEIRPGVIRFVYRIRF
jgi:hypothetical protein